MRPNRRKLNNAVMYGVMAMAMMVLIVVMLFSYFFKDAIDSKSAAKKDKTEQTVKNADKKSIDVKNADKTAETQQKQAE